MKRWRGCVKRDLIFIIRKKRGFPRHAGRAGGSIETQNFLGRRPVLDLGAKRRPQKESLGEAKAANSKGFDEVAARFEAHAGTTGYLDGALGADCHFGVDDVFGPIAPAGGDIARE
jgi:hypothetical protein